MTRYVALLRGINVGGRNIIAMPALKACCEAEGLEDVATYIQSGNVIFSSNEKAPLLFGRTLLEPSSLPAPPPVFIRSRAHPSRPTGFLAR